MAAMRKPVIAPMHLFWTACVMVTAGVSAQYRMMPFLQGDTVMSSGHQIPVALAAPRLAHILYGMGALMFLQGIIEARRLTDAHRRYIAALPRWEQWKIWPFHGVNASDPASQQPLPPAA